MSWHSRLVEQLQTFEREQDRGALAALRRSLDGEVSSFAGAAQHIARFLPSSLRARDEANAYLVAGLFGLAPTTAKGTPVARAFRLVGLNTESGSLELRFTSLLAASLEDVATHLRHAVTLIRANDIDIDWARLLHDLGSWEQPDGFIQKKWAREFWAFNDDTTRNTDTTGAES